MPTAAERFALRLASDAGKAIAVLLAGVGDRLGLFSALSKAPLDPDSLAARAGIHPRYAREWLYAMAAAGYVSGEKGRYSLPPDRAEVLANEGGPLFMGGTLQMLLGMVGVLQPLRDAFRTGRGVPQEAYPQDTWEGMERDMAGLYEHKLVSEWLPRVPAVRALLEAGALVADIGAFSRARFVGYDAHAPNVAHAAERAVKLGLSERIRFEVRDASDGLPPMDLALTFDVVHDAARPLELASAIRRALRHGGLWFALDVPAQEDPTDNNDPLTVVRWGFSLLYCMSVSLAEGGAGLGTFGLTESRMRALCADAGFSAVRVERLSFHALYEVAP